MTKAIENQDASHVVETPMTSMIERVAMDPDIPIEKLERMLDMQERIWAKEARDAFYADFSMMQSEMPEVPRRGEIKIRGVVQSRYALFEDIIGHCRPVLEKFGFSMMHKSRVENGEMIVTGILAHRAGHTEQDEIPLPYDTSGNKNATQVRGSTLSYGKRYTASNLLLITSHGEDDDAQAATETITADQYAHLRDLMEKTGTETDKFERLLNVENIEEMPANLLQTAMNLLTAKLNAKKKGSE